MNKLDQKVAVVTGGTSGIGLAIAKRFAHEGAHVYITGRRQSELDNAVKEIGKNATGISGDVSKLDDLDKLYELIKKEKGQIDILVANAGGGSFAPLEHITEEHFDSIFNNNVKGLLFSVQKSLPLFNQGGSVILIGSNIGTKGTPAFSVYSATKAAVRSFARSWTNDLKDRGIRVNSIAPGPTATPGLFGLVPEDQKENLKQALISTIPLDRLAEPEEIANAALFLASDESQFVSGIELVIDGGQTQV